MRLHLQDSNKTLFIYRIIKSHIWLIGIIFVLGCSSRSGDPEWALCEDGELCSPVVEVLTISNEPPLEPDSQFWSSSEGPKNTKIELGPQLITNPQWPDPSVKTVTVSAAKNESHIAIRVEWDDTTIDNKFSPSNLYTDQIAIMFPMNVGDEVPMITQERAYTSPIWYAPRD